MFNFFKIYKKMIIIFFAIEIIFLSVTVFFYHYDDDYENKFLFYSILFAIPSIICNVLIFIAIPEYHKLPLSEKYDVYRVNLASITPQITVYADRSKKSNICDAEKQVVDTILVQHTHSDKYYKEIITGKLIPVSQVAYEITYSKYVGEVIEGKSYYNFTSPLFIYVFSGYSRTGRFLGYWNDSQKFATLDEIEQYIQKRKNGYKGFPSFEKYLDSLYEQAKRYYKTAKQKNEISDETKIKKILKKL